MPLLGRQIIVITAQRSTAFANLIFGAFFLVLGIGSMVAYRDDPHNLGAWCSIFVLMGCGLLAMGVFLLTGNVRIHEQGIVARSFFTGRNEILFDNVKSFKFEQRKGSGPVLGLFMTLIPLQGRPLRASAGSHSEHGRALLTLRSQLTEKVAATMQKTLQRSGSVPWLASSVGLHGRAVTISRDGFVLSDRKTEERILFGEVRLAISGGIFYLERRINGKRVAARVCAAENFYPGLQLLSVMSPGLEQ